MGGWIEIDTDKPGEQIWHELLSALLTSDVNKWAQISINYNLPSQTLIKL